MVRHHFPDFLEDAAQYAQAESFWFQLWESLVRFTGQQAEWKHPWLRTASANGTPFRDGDPIFSAISPERRMAVRVIQHEAEDAGPELDFWVDTFGDEGEAVRVLVISCSLSDEAAIYARDLLYSWLEQGAVEVKQYLLYSWLDRGAVEAKQAAEGPATVRPPREQHRRPRQPVPA
jgi:hypothetical protein